MLNRDGVPQSESYFAYFLLLRGPFLISRTSLMSIGSTIIGPPIQPPLGAGGQEANGAGGHTSLGAGGQISFGAVGHDFGPAAQTIGAGGHNFGATGQGFGPSLQMIGAGGQGFGATLQMIGAGTQGFGAGAQMITGLISCRKSGRFPTRWLTGRLGAACWGEPVVRR